jgi:hypothetical protein
LRAKQLSAANYRLRELAMRRSSVLTAFISVDFMVGNVMFGNVAFGARVFGVAVFGVVAAASDAEARLDLYVNKSTQQIQIIQNGTLVYVWPVSTGRDRFSTPSGVYTPERLERTWFSKAYYNSPMPHAIFFHNGYAIHGSYDIARLGGPASHGCVRLHPRNAALLFAMVQQEGPGATTIFVGGNSDRPPPRYRDDDEAWQPPYRRDAPTARGYPREPGTDSRMPPVEEPGRYVDRRGAWPPPGPETPYYNRDYNRDRYDGSDPYADPGRYQRAPDAAPYSENDRYDDRRRVPHSPRAVPDYSADPYVDGRDAPRGPEPGRRFSPYYPDRRSDGRGAGPQGQKTPPYDADRYADGPTRQRGDSPLAMRGTDPANRMPAPRLNGEMPIERMPVERLPAVRLPAERPAGLRGTLRPVTANARPGPAQSPARFPDEPFSRHTVAGDARTLPPVLPGPAPTSVLPPLPTPAVSAAPPLPPAASAPAARQEQPPAEQQEASSVFGYKVLPRSYWAGASWRWRLKDEAPPPASQ